jgi:CelD/BcsL family acetyltransferase involved in cellulose biosynthesis
MMELKVIDNIQDFEKLIPAWNQIYSELPLLTPFSASDWNFTWWKYYGKGKQLFILTIYQDNQLCGIVPLYIQQKKGAKIIKLLGSGHSDYLDFLLLPELEKECLAFIYDYLFKQKNWDILDLIDIPEISILIQDSTMLLSPLSTKVSILPGFICPYLQWEGSYDEFLKSKSSNFRYDLKRKLKRAQQLGEVSFRIIENNMNDSISFAKIADIYEKRWAKKATISAIRSDSGQKLLLETKIKIPVMTIKNEPIAFCLGFIEHNKFYYYIPSFDPEFINISPGQLLIAFIVENFHNLGITELDFMKGEEPYKFKWSTSVRTTHRLLISNNSIKSQVVHLMQVSYIKFRNRARTSEILRWIRFDLLGKINFLLKKIFNN